MSDQLVSVQALSDFFKNKEKYFLNQKDGHRGILDDSGYGVQGEYNETFKYYRHPDWPANLFFQEIYVTDSYGDNQYLYSFGFVQGKEKTITLFEPI